MATGDMNYGSRSDYNRVSRCIDREMVQYDRDQAIETHREKVLQ